MPYAAPRACSSDPRCPEVQPCPVHTRKAWAGRSSARERGYTYEWDKAARQMRTSVEACGYCGQRLATQLDHQVPLSQGGSRDPKDNGMPTCDQCHAKKTAREKRRVS